MATLALTVVGNAIAPGVGGFIGAAVGGIIDNMLIFPALFPKPATTGPRMGDKSLQLASEGSEMKWIIGPKNRPAGTVIYISDLIEQEDQIDGGKNGGDVTLYKYFVDVAIAVCETKGLPNNRVFKIKRIWGDSKLLYSNGTRYKCDAITIYRGDQTTPDPLLEARLGAGNVPHYRNTCYVVIKKLALEDFGNRLPNITFELSQSEDLSAGEAIALIVERSGLATNEYDVTRVNACFKGYTIAGPQPASDSLAPILQGFAISCIEADGAIKFVSRGQEDVISVPSADLAAREAGGEPETRPYERTDSNDWNLPREVAVKFISDDNDLQQGTERERRTDFGSDNVVTMDLPLTLSPTDARAFARRALWAAEAERQRVRLMLPPSYVHVTEGDLLSLPGGVQVFAAEVTRGANFMIDVRGVTTLPEVYTQTGSAQSPFGINPNPSRPPDLEFVVVDGPALTDALADATGLFYACRTEDQAVAFQGAGLYSSATFGGTYVALRTIGGEADMGRVVVPPSAAPTIDGSYWDTTSAIEVTMGEGELASVTEQECLDGANRALLVSANGTAELIGFTTATPAGVGTDRYVLTNLLRRLKGTPLVSSPSVILPVTTAIGFLSDNALLGTTNFYKIASVGANLSNEPALQVACTGATRKPLAPTHLQAREGPDDRDSYDSVSTSASTQQATRSAGFPNVLPGSYITLGGSSDATRNTSWLVASKPNATTLVLSNATGYTLGDESGLSIARGHVKDVRVSWSRRGKKNASIFSPAPTSQDENPVEFLVEVRRGGLLSAPVRSAVVTTQEWVYGNDDRDLDGTLTAGRLMITVRQRSTVVGLGYPNTLEFRP